MLNGEFETLREGKNSIFLCEPETFLLFQLEDRDLKSKLEKLLDIQMSFKNKQIITSWLSSLCKDQDCKTHITSKKWLCDTHEILKKNLWDPWFLKDQSPSVKCDGLVHYTRWGKGLKPVLVSGKSAETLRRSLEADVFGFDRISFENLALPG